MIHVSELSKSFPNRQQQVLDRVHLEVAAGELVAVLGRSGSGKTTLLNIIGGIDREYQGRVEVGGADLATLSDRRLSEFRNREVGFVFQAFHLVDGVSCRDNVALPAVFARGERVAQRSAVLRRAEEVLEQVGLAGLAEQRPAHLSGGQKQRVALARALFHRPRVLLCDEVTGNLDSDTGRRIIDLLAAVNREQRVTLLMVTHDPEIAAVADRVLRLDNGCLQGGGG